MSMNPYESPNSVGGEWSAEYGFKLFLQVFSVAYASLGAAVLSIVAYSAMSFVRIAIQCDCSVSDVVASNEEKAESLLLALLTGVGVSAISGVLLFCSRRIAQPQRKEATGR